jgi:hypothetical protein
MRGVPGRAMTDFVEQVIARLDPVFAPRGFPCQRSSAEADSVLFHCDGADIANVATRYPAWFADVARSYGDAEVTCLDLWVQQEDGKRFVDFENVTDEELANAAGRDAVARMHSLAAGPLDSWLDQVALVLGSFFDSIEARE